MEPPNSGKKFIIGNWKMQAAATEAGCLAIAVVERFRMEKTAFCLV